MSGLDIREYKTQNIRFLLTNGWGAWSARGKGEAEEDRRRVATRMRLRTRTDESLILVGLEIWFSS